MERHFDDCLDILANEAPFESFKLMQKVDALNNKEERSSRLPQESEVDLQLGCCTEHVELLNSYTT